MIRSLNGFDLLLIPVDGAAFNDTIGSAGSANNLIKYKTGYLLN